MLFIISSFILSLLNNIIHKSRFIPSSLLDNIVGIIHQSSFIPSLLNSVVLLFWRSDYDIMIKIQSFII